jgi:hypothetical protein
MKRLWKFVGIATLVAILGVAAVGAVAYAQDDESGGPFDFGARFREAIAGILGISVEEYDAAVEKAQEQIVGEALEEGWLTEDQAEKMQERMEQGFGPRGMGKGFMMPHKGFMGRGGDSLLDVAAEKLDLSVEDLRAELRDGKTIADLAQEKGVDPQEIVDAFLVQLEESLQQAVEYGDLTQNQADWMLEKAAESLPDRLEDTCQGRFPGGMRGGGRPGRMRGFPGQDDA